MIYNDSVSQNSEVGLGLARGGPGFTVAFRGTAHVRLGPGRYRAQSPFARMPSRRLRREKFHPDRRTGCPGRARGHGFNRTAEIKIGVVGPAPHDRQQIRASVGSLGPGAAMRFRQQVLSKLWPRALCPDIGYDDLGETSDGGAASMAFWRMATGRGLGRGRALRAQFPESYRKSGADATPAETHRRNTHLGPRKHAPRQP